MRHKSVFMSLNTPVLRNGPIFCREILRREILERIVPELDWKIAPCPLLISRPYFLIFSMSHSININRTSSGFASSRLIYISLSRIILPQSFCRTAAKVTQGMQASHEHPGNSGTTGPLHSHPFSVPLKHRLHKRSTPQRQPVYKIPNPMP